jgi:hypothetical protein
MLDEILYVVCNGDIPVQLPVSFIALFINRYNNKFLPLLWQSFFTPN